MGVNPDRAAFAISQSTADLQDTVHGVLRRLHQLHSTVHDFYRARLLAVATQAPLSLHSKSGTL